MKKFLIAALLAASTIGVAAPAAIAQPYSYHHYYHHHFFHPYHRFYGRGRLCRFHPYRCGY